MELIYGQTGCRVLEAAVVRVRMGVEGGRADTDKLQLSHARSESSSLKAQIKAALHPNKEKKIEDVGNLKKKKTIVCCIDLAVMHDAVNTIRLISGSQHPKRSRFSLNKKHCGVYQA